MAAQDLISRRDADYDLSEIDLRNATDDELSEVSDILSLGLSVEEMKTVRDYYVKEDRVATDAELQSLGQAWSEHCCYKSTKVLLKEFVFGIDRDDVLSRGDAGTMVFDKEHAYCLRVESHNHPSAIEPYGGAATGIGGIVRDIICMGAQPVGLADPLCFGPIDTEKEMPKGIKHPRYLMNGVVSGIRDYGNRIGIPTISGGFFFDDSYIGNCLVNVCCFGLVKRDDLLNNFASGPGEVMILFGGRTGRDGIHGVNFASRDISSSAETEDRGAVQLGDPIMKEPVIHACTELAERHLVTGMKDLGGGGLSCVVGEMAIEMGCGADVDLDKVPLKETGLAPWEIWVSESQERMMCTCTPDKVDEIMAVFDLWDIIATPIARTTDTGRTRLFWNGEKIFDMDIDFLTGGPVYTRPYVEPEPSTKEGEVFPELPSIGETLLTLLSDLNVASKEWAIRQYDHEVRARTVLKPLVGKLNQTGPGDASLLAPKPGSKKGLACAVGCNPWYTKADPYRGGMASVNEAMRNVVAVGAKPDALTDCLNFGNPEVPERLGELRAALRGIGDIARELNIPIPSGNVSMYNQSPGGEYILPTPMMVCCGLMPDVRKAVSADFKDTGHVIYQVGETHDEMGASLLFRKFGGKGGEVPATDIQGFKKTAERLLEAINKNLVLACHDCSEGGLAVAVAEMCIAGQVGAQIDLSLIGGSDAIRLFSESQSRWVVEVDGEFADEFEKILKEMAVPIGITRGDAFTLVGTDVNVPLSDMTAAWNDPIWDIMGGEQ